jgi:hypothetical protein
VRRVVQFVDTCREPVPVSRPRLRLLLGHRYARRKSDTRIGAAGVAFGGSTIGWNGRSRAEDARVRALADAGAPP